MVLYNNNIEDYINRCNVLFFIDDIMLQLILYFCSNALIVNTTKSKYMIIHTPNKFENVDREYGELEING